MADGSSPEKINMGRCSSDESMEEDVLKSKYTKSNIKFNEYFQCIVIGQAVWGLFPLTMGCCVAVSATCLELDSRNFDLSSWIIGIFLGIKV